MVEKKVVITCPIGLHARPATELVDIAKKCGCAVTLELNGKTANATSIINIMTLGATGGSEINVICEGENEQAVLEQITTFIEQITE